MNDYNLKYGSRDVVKAAIYMALSENRDEEKILKHQYHENGIKCCAVDFGGDYISSITKIIERAVVAAKREEVIFENHAEQVRLGATREA